MKIPFAFLFIFSLTFGQLFAAEPWFANKFPASLIDSTGQPVDTVTALNGKMVAVYFSASWCPPCRKFTPELVKFYKKVSKKANIEIVFIGCDNNAEAMQKYIKDYKMPWLSLPFRNPAAAVLMRELKVTGIPKLVVFDAKGNIVAHDARADISSLKENAVKKWRAASRKNTSGKQKKVAGKNSVPSEKSQNKKK